MKYITITSRHLTTSHISHCHYLTSRPVEQMTGSFVFKDHLEVLEGASARTFLKAVSAAPTCDGLRCQKTLPFAKSSLSWIQLLLFSAGVARVERKKLVFSKAKNGFEHLNFSQSTTTITFYHSGPLLHITLRQVFPKASFF